MDSKNVFKCADIEIVRKVSNEYHRWPEPYELEQAEESGYFGGNYQFDNYWGWSWDDARQVWEQEIEYLQRIELAETPEDDFYKYKTRDFKILKYQVSI